MAFAQDHHDVVARDQALESRGGLVRRTGGVLEDDFQFLATDAALGIDVFRGELDALFKGRSRGGGRSGAGADDPYLDRVLSPGAAAEQQHGGDQSDAAFTLHEQPPNLKCESACRRPPAAGGLP